MASIMYALRKWEHLLRYKPFLLHSDHQVLQWIQGLKKPMRIIHRWIQELATFSYQLIWKPS